MREQKFFKRFRPARVAMPNLVADQTRSFQAFLESGLKETFKEFTPIKDYSGKKFDLEFGQSVRDPLSIFSNFPSGNQRDAK